MNKCPCTAKTPILRIIAAACCATVAAVQADQAAVTPAEYVANLGKGVDVDWAKTKQGIHLYDARYAQDFKARGFSHVRIRVRDDLHTGLLRHLDKVIDDCLKNNLIPILAYQADSFKNEPTMQNEARVVAWWTTVAERYQERSPWLSFDILIEVSDALNKEPEALNRLYEKVVTAIRRTNTQRNVFIAPRVRSSPEYLSELAIPTRHDNHLLVEWHFYASGPSKENPRKLWATASEKEKDLVRAKIRLAVDWQKKTGVRTWVGAWMPGNYNEQNNFSIAEQVEFAGFVSCELTRNNIPFAINSDSKFYDRETRQWRAEMAPVLDKVLRTDCG